MNDRLKALLREAARTSGAGRLDDLGRVLRQALAGLTPTADRPAGRGSDWNPDRPAGHGSDWDPDDRADVGGPADAGDDLPDQPGDSFVAGLHRHGALTRGYKLYRPPAAAAAPALVVMLHGCTQDPDDFAAGTAMNALAQEQGFFVLYPAQSQQANPSRCWNWFKRTHQQRDRGEPALIASLTRAVVAHHRIDAQRVYVAGLSAGGAMAAIVAAAYPEVFAAAGVHSGLPVGSAGNAAEALAVMKRGGGGGIGGIGSVADGVGGAGGAGGAGPARRLPVPIIVFHGDQDRVVHPGNGERVIADVVAAAAAPAARVERGRSAGGRSFTRSIHADASGRVVAEHWLVHGAGHAWAGGRAAGSHTDAAGPDATAEMLRFFLRHGRPGGG